MKMKKTYINYTKYVHKLHKIVHKLHKIVHKLHKIRI